MYPCKYRPPSKSSSLDSCEKKRRLCTKKPGQPCSCNCPRKLDAYETCKENLRDITESIAKVLELIGVCRDLVEPSKQFIFALFHHYDYARWSFDPEEPQKICKEHIMHIFVKIFDFERLFAEMAYYIVKRAFKAYFTNKCKGLLNAALDTEITAQDTGAWLHAATTTTRVIKEHEILLKRLPHHYERKIYKIYRALVEKMQKRVEPLIVPLCSCKNCVGVRVPVAKEFEKKTIEKPKAKPCKCYPCSTYSGSRPLKPGPRPERPNKWKIFGIDARDSKGNTIPSFRHCVGKCVKNPIVAEDIDCRDLQDPRPEIPGVPWCTKCKIYKLICDCQDNGNRESQGPFETHWFRVYEDEEEGKPIPGDIKDDPHNHHCPIDCDLLSILSNTTVPSDVPPEEEEDDNDYCPCCFFGDGEEEESGEEEETDDEERNANFVQPFCYCQKQEDVGI